MPIRFVKSVIPFIVIGFSAFVVACSSLSTTTEKTVETTAQRKSRIEGARAAAHI